MQPIELLKTRRSIRAYTPQAVPREIIEDIIDCGRLAPTARNEQPWEFVVVTDKALRSRIAQAADYGRFIADAPACVAVLSRQTKYYLEDGSAATLNILLAAHAHGLGACWVAGDKKPYAARVVQMVGAPEDYRLISLVSIGYPAEKPETRKRPLREMLHWERF
ncbi:MAG: nitroreductase family protein [Acidobacteria bacterium]|nr:nitroreductase family protein [Acidobacteriota bacterium]